MIHRIIHLILIMLLTLCSTNSHAEIHDSANYLDNLALMNNLNAINPQIAARLVSPLI